MSSKKSKKALGAIRHELLSKPLALSALMTVSGGIYAESDMLEEVEVTGLRASIEQSIDTKRDADAIVDAITAEDMGKFPDQNVADSLARITGVSVTRGFGEGEKVAIRGTSPSQNRTLLNGHAVASADWFVLDNPSRAFNYTLLPSSMVASLEVYKTPEAQIQAGSIGGTVILNTRKPLDQDANSGNITVESQYSTESDKYDPQFSGMYSWKNDDETFGFIGAYAYQKRQLVRTGKEALGFSQQTIQPDGASEAKDYWAPRAVGDAYFTQERKRETFMFTAQGRPTDRSEFVVNYLNSTLDADNTNINNYSWFTDRGNGGIQSNAAIVGSGVAAGTVSNAYSEYYVIDRQSDSATQSLNLNYSYDFDTAKLTTDIGVTKATGGTSNDRHYNFDTFAHSASFDKNLNVVRTIEDADTGEISTETTADLLNRGFGWMQEGSRTMEDEEKYAMLDLVIPAEAGIFNEFKTGAILRMHKKSQAGSMTRFHLLADSQHANGSATADYGDMNADNPTPPFPRWLWGKLNAGKLSDYVSDVDGAPYPVLNVDKAAKDIYPAAAYDFPTITTMDPSQTWDVKEKIFGGYISGNFEADALKGNIGLRVVETRVQSTGYQYNGDAYGAILDKVGNYAMFINAANIYNPDYDLRQETVKFDYLSVLPSLNLTYEINENILLRGALARTMARPDYAKLANTRWQNSAFAGFIGNPKLDPEYANQADLSFEIYPAELAIISAAAFYKDIDNTIVNTVVTMDVYDPSSATGTSSLDFLRSSNGKGSTLSGVELGYQHGFGDFGVIANYTYSHADSKDDRDPVNNPGSGLVEGNSKHMANFTAYYENDLFTVRGMYNYRTKYYAGISEFGSEMYIKGYGQTDLSASLNIPGVEGLSISLDGINILEEKLNYYHIDEDRKAREYENGARWLLGLSYNF